MKTIAWNVDTQFDFMRADGKLPVPEAQTIENNLSQLTDYFRQTNTKVVNTADWHTEETSEISDTPDFIKTFPEHCMAYSPGAEYVEATRPQNPYVIDWQDDSINLDKIAQNREIVLYKDEFSCFTGSPHTQEVISALNPDRVIVYGVATNVCVDYAVTGLLEKGIEVYVVGDAIKELPGIPSPISNWVDSGAKIILTKEVNKYIMEVEK